jgi:hypothetical protein
LTLNYPADWKFDGFETALPPQAADEFFDVMLKISENKQSVVESFKSAFGGSSGSSNLGWAESDLRKLADSCASNAATYVDSLWTGIEAAQTAGCKVPSLTTINKILLKHSVPLRIQPPDLVLTIGDAALGNEGADSALESESPISRFALGEEIGSGGYGVVYKARRTTSIADFEFALKVLNPSSFARNPEKAVRRFQREVQAMQTLQHRAIIPYFDAGMTRERKPYVVMPLIVGLDLRAATSGSEIVDVLEKFSEITNAIEYAHQRGVLHRDLKPSNILVRTSDNQPIILDFGASYFLNELSDGSLTSEVVGTIGYIPSEVLNNPKERTPLQDVFACGVMLYECIARRMPNLVDYESLERIDSSFRSLDAIVKKATASARKRLTSAADFHSLLEVERIRLS